MEEPTSLGVAPELIEGVPTWEGRAEGEVDREAKGEILGAALIDAEMDALGEEDAEALEEMEGDTRRVMDTLED